MLQRFLLSVSVILLLAACSLPIKEAKINYTHEPGPAAILLSDPQVFSRESLINDRLKELKYVRARLDASAAADFELGTDLERQISTVRALGASLGVGFDPVGGETIGRNRALARANHQDALRDLEQQRALDEVQHQINMAALENQLQVTEKRLTEIKTDGDDSNAGTSGAGADTSADTAAVPTVTVPNGSENQERLTAAMQELRELIGTGRPRGTGDSREMFRDINAYRSDLRAHQDTARLDDGHDFDGNALYRLRFRATVLPGPNNDQLGVARVLVKPPTISDEELVRLYVEWLAHVSYRLNSSPNDDASWSADYELLGASGLFAIADINLSSLESNQCGRNPGGDIERLRLPLPRSLEVNFSNVEAWFSSQLNSPALTSLKANSVGDDDAQLFIRTMPGTVAAAGNVAQWSNRSYCIVQLLLSRFVGAYKLEHDEYSRETDAKLMQDPGFLKFREEIRKKIAVARVLNVEPAELNQRISTVSQAAQAIQLGLAVSAAASGSGVAGNGSIDSASQVATRVNALERHPRVVGFADVSKKSQSFGWVFAPKIRLNVGVARQSTELEFLPSNFEVSADISVPAWLTAIELSTQSAWISNFYAGRVNLDRPIGLPIRTVALPRSRGDLDALTNYLSQRLLGAGTGARISRVMPNQVSLCSNNVRLAIHGANLWRNARVTLGGVVGKNIEVLPDMEGIGVDFEASKLRALVASGMRMTDLVVWTQSGNATYRMPLRPVSVNGTSCGEPSRLVMQPTTVSACADQWTIVARSSSRLEATRMRLVSGLGTATDCRGLLAREEHRNIDREKIFECTMDRPKNFKSGKLELVGIAGDHVQQGTLNVAACATTASGGTTTQQQPPAPKLVAVIEGGDKYRTCDAAAVVVVSGPGSDKIKTATMLETNAVVSPFATHAVLRFDRLPTLDKKKDYGDSKVALALKDSAGKSIATLDLPTQPCP